MGLTSAFAPARLRHCDEETITPGCRVARSSRVKFGQLRSNEEKTRLSVPSYLSEDSVSLHEVSHDASVSLILRCITGGSVKYLTVVEYAHGHYLYCGLFHFSYVDPHLSWTSLYELYKNHLNGEESVSITTLQRRCKKDLCTCLFQVTIL